MALLMKSIALGSAVLTAVLTGLYLHTPQPLLLSAAITCGTVAYHFIMRLAVGGLYDVLMHNRARLHRAWYRPHPWEERLYRRLGIHRIKGSLPTYAPALFSPRLHTWDEIAQAMCQAELVHETIAVLSFVPLLFSLRWGAFAVFLITSLLSASFDLLFVIMQRFNRPRVLRMVQREQKKNAAVLGGTQCQDL